MADFYVKVVPGSDEFRIEDSDIVKVFLTESAENGRANAELVSKLSNILGQRPAIISGHRSRRKKLKVQMGKEEAEDILESFSDD